MSAGTRSSGQRQPLARAFYRPRGRRRILGHLWSLGALLVLVVSPWQGVGRAQPAPEHVERDRRDAALTHFEAGRREFEGRRYRQAVREFELAYAHMPSADLLFNIARSLEELGDDRRAVALYRRYLRDRVDAPDAEEVRQRIARLEGEEKQRRGASGAASGRVRVDSNVEGALVSLNGAVIGPTPVERTLALEPGRYRFEVTRPGYLPFLADLSVGEAGSLTVGYAKLERADVEQQPDTAGSAWPWVLGAVSAACLLGSAGLAVMAAGAEGSDGQARAAEWFFGGGVLLGFGAATWASATTSQTR